MSRSYDFHPEITFYAEHGEVRPEFFQKLRDLVRRRARRYPPGLFLIGAEVWNAEAINEVALEFATGWLFDPDNLRVRYLVDAACKDDRLDGLMVRMFEQFLVHSLAKKNPRKANLIKRVRRRLGAMEKAGQLATTSVGGDTRFRRREKCAAGVVTEQELRESVDFLPPLNPRVYQQGEKTSPTVSNDQLEEILRAIFTRHAGWIPEKTLWTFLSWYLDIFDTVQTSFIQKTSSKTATDTPEDLTAQIVSSCGEQLAHALVAEALGKISARQRQILRLYYLEGLEPREIMERVGIRKSTFYQELARVRSALSEIETENGI
ncbi:MAG: RNA polymerase sigma factor [Syntrophobacteria bacterium]